MYCNCCNRFLDCCICSPDMCWYYRGECKKCKPISSQCGDKIWYKVLEILYSDDSFTRLKMKSFLISQGVTSGWLY